VPRRLQPVRDRRGLSSSATLAWVCEAVERGDLSAADLDGIDLTWGNGEAALALTIKMGKGEGCGAWSGQRRPARGPSTSAKGTADYAVHVHGSEPAYHDSRFSFADGRDVRDRSDARAATPPVRRRGTRRSAPGSACPRRADRKEWNVKWKGTAGNGPRPGAVLQCPQGDERPGAVHVHHADRLAAVGRACSTPLPGGA